MDPVRRASWLAPSGFALFVWAACAVGARGQLPSHGRFELSDTLHVDEADAATKTHLERVRAFLANNQWDEAVETLRQVGENHNGKVIGLTERRYISVRDFCHLQISHLPPEALALYRSRIDAQARKWYEEGLAARDSQRLLSVVEQFFCSRWGDDALLALGELALEQRDYGNARGYWERILPPRYWSRHMAPGVQADGTPEWLVYPDTDLDLAAVCARLLLVRILAGEPEAARAGLQAYEQEFGEAEGRLAGRQVQFAAALADLLTESLNWPARHSPSDWKTFAGSPTRNQQFAGPVEVGAVRWRAALSAAPEPTTSQRRVADSSVLSCHPVLVGDLVFVNDPYEIRAYNVHTGQPAWGNNPVIYPSDVIKITEPQRTGGRSGTAHGVARFTMTAFKDRLYARMGNPVTSVPAEPINHHPPGGYLLCLSLAGQGSVVWDSRSRVPLDEGWAFEGSPVCDGTSVYVAMRRGDTHQPQAHVACLNAETGRLRWRRMVCGAETPAQGQLEEITHQLLALDHGTIYFSTNLGAVAALDARDGQVKWITRYPRSKAVEPGERARHWQRDLTPCLYDRGVVYAAPADSRGLMAFDAPTGMVLWPSPWPEDAVHLLGTGGGNLIASGDKLWFINTVTGKLSADAWPAGPTPKGFGRGVLAGGKVYWPTQTAIEVFDQRTGRREREIELVTRGKDVSGGNLLVVDGSLLVANQRELIVFSPQGGTSPNPAGAEISQGPSGRIQR